MNDKPKRRFEGIDYQFRPASYWWKRGDPSDDILHEVAEPERRQIISRYWEEGRLDELDETMQPNARGFAEQNDPATFHPSPMDEEDLPPYLPERIGIVYIELASVLSDEINIKAWLVGRERIRFEMLDDNHGGYDFNPQESTKRLSFEELILMIDGVNDGERGGLGMVFNWYNRLEGVSTVESLRHFTTVTSDFYPDLFKHYDALHEAWVQAEQSDTEKNDTRQLPGSC